MVTLRSFEKVRKALEKKARERKDAGNVKNGKLTPEGGLRARAVLLGIPRPAG